MTVRLLLATLLAWMLLAPAGFAQVLNPGFELDAFGADPPPTNWTTTRAPLIGTSGAVVTFTPRTGANHYRMGLSTPGGTATLSQVINTPNVGNQYQITYFVQTTVIPIAGDSVTAQWGATNQAATLIAGTYVMNQVTTTAAAATTTLTVTGLAQTNNSFSFDDFSIVDLGAGPAGAPEINREKLAIPLAIGLGLLMVLADRRRRVLVS